MTALTTGIPPGVHGPEPRRGENQLQFLVAQYGTQWENFVEALVRRSNIQPQTRRLLESLNIGAITDDRIVNEVETWANERMPTHGRTLSCLARLRERLRDEIYGVELVQVLWPREENPYEDAAIEREATSMGVEVLSISTGMNRTMDFAGLLPHVRGDFFWVVPGGSRIEPSLFTASLRRIFDEFDRNSRMAMYYDGSYSAIYRSSALRELARSRGFIPANMQDTARELQNIGYSFCGDRGRDTALCTYERIYAAGVF